MSVPTPATSAVPAGWIYEHSADDSARFVLGTVGTNPLVCVGVNPSTARPNELDQTLRRVRGYAQRNRNDSWVMLNLYPQRSTDPDGLHRTYSPELKAENEGTSPASSAVASSLWWPHGASRSRHARTCATCSWTSFASPTLPHATGSRLAISLLRSTLGIPRAVHTCRLFTSTWARTSAGFELVASPAHVVATLRSRRTGMGDARDGPLIEHGPRKDRGCSADLPHRACNDMLSV
ncbi:DUF1643 domain-containing protein [Microbacterium sp. AK009]|uniref:DUF1643 domain-containing protein n=1 Tax=Microbacterium sp. AK009 TaxID=2723068 RepID=UPI0015CA3BB9